MRRMRIALFFAVASLSAVSPAHELQAQRRSAAGVYYPGADGRWERRIPERFGMDSARVAAAVAFAVASESKAPRDLLLAHVQSFGREPFGDAVGPFK
ncbi:MAG: serine hydrolase, partial [Tepidisphaeraceae bacterium]